jgi:type IV pilus assembly protein PilB
LGAPFVIIGARVVPPAVVALVPTKIIRSRRVLPLEKLTEHRRGPLVVAFADPADLGAVDEIAFATGLAVRTVLAAEWDIQQAIERHLGSGQPGSGPTQERQRAAVDLPADTSPLAGSPRRGFFH